MSQNRKDFPSIINSEAGKERRREGRESQGGKGKPGMKSLNKLDSVEAIIAKSLINKIKMQSRENIVFVICITDKGLIILMDQELYKSTWDLKRTSKQRRKWTKDM